MFPPVSRALLMGMALLATVVAVPAYASSPAKPGPTPTQIRTAVASAKHSQDLWATVNICNTRRHRDQIGIRAQLPALGFSSTMSIKIQVDYWTGKVFVPDPNPGATELVKLGTAATGVRQQGWNFQFGPGAGKLSGTVEFEWARGGKTIGTFTQKTTAGHSNQVNGAEPPGHSAATCRIS
jgi:hypothetical protein